MSVASQPKDSMKCKIKALFGFDIGLPKILGLTVKVDGLHRLNQDVLIVELATLSL